MSQQRLQSRAAASCSSSCISLRHTPHVTVLARSRGVLLVSARVATAPKVVYMPKFLSAEDAAAIRKEASSLQSQLRPELNCIAQGRLGCYLQGGRSSASARVFGSRETAALLSQRLRSPFPLFLSDFPIELRQYPKGAAMPWHKDEQMYASPQWEVIYTIDNSSDSTTEWRDESGKEHSLWTEPNSLLAVQAEGWEHRVLPVRTGSRSILKLAFTSSSIKLPAYSANLGREAYAA